MNKNTPAANRAAIRVRRGKVKPVEQSNHMLGLKRFQKLIDRICTGMQEMASEVHASSPEEHFAAVMFDHGNKQGVNLYGSGFRISIEMVETGAAKNGL